MNRITQFALFLLIMAAAAHLPAQVKFIPKAGVNFSGFEGDIRDFQASSRIGWNAGFDMRVGRGALYLYPGLQYHTFTAALEKNSELPSNLKLEDNTTIQALKASLNAGLRLTGEGGLLTLHARGGVSPTYVLGVRERQDFDLTKEDLNTLTWGANVGLALDVLFLTVDVGYEFGLNEFFKGTGEKPKGLTASVGIRF